MVITVTGQFDVQMATDLGFQKQTMPLHLVKDY